MRRHRISHLITRRGLLLAFLAASAGCSSAPTRTPPAPMAALRINEAAASSYQAVEHVEADALMAAYGSGHNEPSKLVSAEARPKKPLNVLVLSGGGQYASYAGGVLVGWTKSGKRPCFDVVTGVSSGSFLAVYAYLGPKYDVNIERMARSLKTSDVFVYRPFYYWLCHNSIGSSEPLQRLIEAEINDECLADIRAAHHSGRRLFVGTMNQRTRRLVIWDIGAIACGNRPDAGLLVRKILVASSSIPGVVPSVDIDVEINGVAVREDHADGGAVSQGFVKFGPEVAAPDPSSPGAKWLAGSNLYAIAGGKLYADTVEGKLGMLKRITSTVSGTLYALYRADLWRIYSLCAVSGMKFHQAAVPGDIKVVLGSTTFDADTMQRLYEDGYAHALRGDVWRETPPGYDSEEDETPRGQE
jgi:hypothetical protein